MAKIRNGFIEALDPDEVFVFGSNLAGRHGKGAALTARQRFGAIYGQGEGLQGNAYALPTKDKRLRGRSLDEIGASLRQLAADAAQHSDRTFYLTRVGQGLAAMPEAAIREQVVAAGLPPNVKPWWEWEVSGSADGVGAMSRPFRLVVAGGRDFQDPAFLDQALQRSLQDYGPAELLQQLDEAHPYGPLQIVSGGARGADALGEQWAKAAGVPVQRYPAAWDDINAPGAVVRTNRQGRPYNANAGFARNALMAQNADAVLVMPGGRGTDHMVKVAQEQGLPVWDARGGNLDAIELLAAQKAAAAPPPVSAPVSQATATPAMEQLSFFDDAPRFAGQAWPWMAGLGGSAALVAAAIQLQSSNPEQPPYPPA